MMSLFQLLSIFTIITSCFDLYCYAMAAPGSTHYGYYVISYQFVYVGSRHGKVQQYPFTVKQMFSCYTAAHRKLDEDQKNRYLNMKDINVERGSGSKL